MALDVVAGRTGKQIEAAKRAQTARLGQSGASGKRKRCKKGKSCGASCIAGVKVCMVDLPWASSQGLKKLANGLQNRPSQPGPVQPGQPGKPEKPPQPPQPGPVQPGQPGQPGKPEKPVQPGQPEKPPQPTQPGPVQPGKPEKPVQPVQPGQGPFRAPDVPKREEKPKEKPKGLISRAKGKVKRLIRKLRDRGVPAEKIKEGVGKLESKAAKPVRGKPEVTPERYNKAAEAVRDRMRKAAEQLNIGEYRRQEERYRKLIEKVGPVVGATDKFSRNEVWKDVHGDSWLKRIRFATIQAKGLSLPKAWENLYRKMWAVDPEKLEVKIRNTATNRPDKVLADGISKELQKLSKREKDAPRRLGEMFEALNKSPIAVFSNEGWKEKVSKGSTRVAEWGHKLAGSGQRHLLRLLNTNITYYGGSPHVQAAGFANMSGNFIAIDRKFTVRDRPATLASVAKELKSIVTGGSGSFLVGGNGSLGKTHTYVHEVGHIMHKRAFLVRGVEDKKEIIKQTEAEIKSLGLRGVSIYGNSKGTSNALEFVAEMYSAYILYGPALKAVMPKEYDWIEKLAKEAYSYSV